ATRPAQAAMPYPHRPSRRRLHRHLAVRLILALFALVLPAPMSTAGDLLVVQDYKMAGDASRMRLVMDFDREPELRSLLLHDRHRLVVALPEAEFRFDDADLSPRGMVREVRHGTVGQGRSRVILSFDGAFAVERLEVLKNETNDGFRVVADIGATSE